MLKKAAKGKRKPSATKKQAKKSTKPAAKQQAKEPAKAAAKSTAPKKGQTKAKSAKSKSKNMTSRPSALSINRAKTLKRPTAELLRKSLPII